MERTITIIVQLTSDCNFNCSYCYVRASTNGVKYSMPIEKVEQFIRNCAKGFDKVRFCWHGGEPLLMGIEFYQKILQIQREISALHKVSFKNAVQTNGSLLNDKWLSFFKESSFSVGVSFDAPPEINQLQRVGEKAISIKYISDIVKKLKKYELSFNSLCVVSGQNVGKGKEIFDFFRSFNANSYSLLLMMKTSLAECPEAPSNKELFELYKTTFELWLNENHSFKVIEPIDTIVRSLLGEKMPKLCAFGNHCLVRMITITSKGDIVPCGSFISQEFILGNAFEEPLSKVLYSRRAESFRNKRTNYVQTHCLDCEFVSICRGGCREVAFWHSGEYDGEYPYCEARKETFTYIRSRLKEILQKGLLK